MEEPIHKPLLRYVNFMVESNNEFHNWLHRSFGDDLIIYLSSQWRLQLWIYWIVIRFLKLDGLAEPQNSFLLRHAIFFLLRTLMHILNFYLQCDPSGDIVVYTVYLLLMTSNKCLPMRGLVYTIFTRFGHGGIYF